MSTSIRTYPTHHTEIADAVLPDENPFARQLRASLSEMVVEMLREGVEMTLYNIGDRLSKFTPKWVLESSEIWKERNRQRWVMEMRPQIFKALSDFFIEGGHEQRIQVQRTMLSALESSGVRIDGRELLDAELPWSGDWKGRFVQFALVGRPQGVRFRCEMTETVSSKIHGAMQAAGFSHDQIRSVLGSMT